MAGENEWKVGKEGGLGKKHKKNYRYRYKYWIGCKVFDANNLNMLFFFDIYQLRWFRFIRLPHSSIKKQKRQQQQQRQQLASLTGLTTTKLLPFSWIISLPFLLFFLFDFCPGCRELAFQHQLFLHVMIYVSLWYSDCWFYWFVEFY